MSLHEYKTKMTFCIADAAQGEIDVAIHYEYTPAEKGCGHDAYRGPEPDHPASVEVQYVTCAVYHLPTSLVDAVAECPHIEQLLIEHAENA